MNECLNKFTAESNEIIDDCMPLCNKIVVGGISKAFEGNPDFLDKALDYYENLIEGIV